MHTTKSNQTEAVSLGEEDVIQGRTEQKSQDQLSHLMVGRLGKIDRRDEIVGHFDLEPCC